MGAKKEKGAESENGCGEREGCGEENGQGELERVRGAGREGHGGAGIPGRGLSPVRSADANGTSKNVKHRKP